MEEWRLPKGGSYFVTPSARAIPAKVKVLAFSLNICRNRAGDRAGPATPGLQPSLIPSDFRELDHRIVHAVEVVSEDAGRDGEQDVDDLSIVVATGLDAVHGISRHGATGSVQGMGEQRERIELGVVRGMTVACSQDLVLAAAGAATNNGMRGQAVIATGFLADRQLDANS